MSGRFSGISRFIFPVLIVLTGVLLAFLNYTPGTFLTGWDTLHPEFNFAQQFSNLILGTLRTDQGLGAVAAHSHMSDLPRVFMLYLASFILPLSMLRYSYIFLCLILGPLGVYFFVKNSLLRGRDFAPVSGFLAGMFYLLNLGTMQQFYVPFEMFMAQYAALGWLFLFASEYVNKPARKTLVLFILTTILAAPMAYAAVLWYAYFAGLILFLSGLVFSARRPEIIKRSAVILTVTILANCFWLLPNIYFLATHAAEVPLVNSNLMFSAEAFLHNKQYGDLADAAIFKGFLFNWSEATGPGLTQNHQLLETWINFLKTPGIEALGYLFALMVLGGALLAVKSRRGEAVGALFIGLFALVMILNMNPPFDYFFSILRDNISIFKEGLRFPYTKFSILQMFAFAAFVGIFWQEVLSLVGKKLPGLSGLVTLLCTVAVCAGLIIYSFPMFQGNLIDPRLRINIPAEYFSLFDYLNSQSGVGRVAPLPVNSQYGWEYHNWGYQGAGFIWFGIKQPVLARDFDRWTPYNEEYFREISSAVYSRDTKLVEKLAQKYQIRYFLLDESVIAPGNKPNALWYYETEDLLSKSTNIRLVRQFGSFIKLYEVTDTGLNNSAYVQAPSDLAAVSPKLTGYLDSALLSFPDYLEGNKTNPGVIFPGRNLTDRYDRIDPSLIKEADSALTITYPEPVPASYPVTETWFGNGIYPRTLVSSGLDMSAENAAKFYRDGDRITVTIPVKPEKTVYLENQVLPPNDCGSTENKLSTRTIKDGALVLSALSGSACDYVSFTGASQDFGQLLTIKARFEEGLPLRLCVSDSISLHCDIDTELDPKPGWQTYYFLLPPLATGGKGYDIHFNNVSIGNVLSTNDIKNVSLIPFPWYRAESLSFVKSPDTRTTEVNPLLIVSESGAGPLEKVVVRSAGSGKDNTLALNYSYEGGWTAFSITAGFPFIRLYPKSLYNNWANAWTVDAGGSNINVYLLYWPDLLELAGLGILPVLFLGACLLLE